VDVVALSGVKAAWREHAFGADRYAVRGSCLNLPVESFGPSLHQKHGTQLVIHFKKARKTFFLLVPSQENRAVTTFAPSCPR